MGVIRRGVRNAFRNTIRTLSITLILGLSIGLALTMLFARQAVQSKIASVEASVGNTITLSPAGMRGFEGGGEAIPETAVTSIEKLDHVISVTGSVNDRLTSSNSNLISAIESGSLGQRFSQGGGDQPAANGGSQNSTHSFTPPVTLIGTTNPSDLSGTMGGGTFSLKEGAIFDSFKSANVALLGTSLASKNSLKVGSTFQAYEKDIKVVGIFDAGNEFANNQVLMPLSAVQKLTDQKGVVTSATVTVDSVANIDAVTTEVKNKLSDKVDVTNSAEQAKTAVEPLENIKNISSLSLFGAVGAGAVIILLTMMMIVRERRREIGVLKAIGASNLVVTLQFVIESITLTVFGSFIGVLLGVFGSNPITNMLVQNSVSTTIQGGVSRGMSVPGSGLGRVMGAAGRGVMSSVQSVQASVGWEIVFYGVGVAILVAILGSAIPAFLISKIRPAEVMRSE